MRNPRGRCCTPRIIHSDSLCNLPACWPKRHNGRLVSNRIRVDAILCLFTSSRTHLDGDYIRKLDPDGCHYGYPVEAGGFL